MAKETKVISRLDDLKSTLVKMESQFAKVLPEHIKPKNFVRIAQTAVSITPALAECDRAGLFTEFLKCAQDGLFPDGREATIQKFKNSAVYMPMIFGICKKARNSGEIKAIDALVVYENDEYDSWVDENGQHFKHKKARGDRGEPILTYAYAQTRDGFYFEEMDEVQMAAIEKMSKQKDGPWKGPFKDEMRRKSALRRLAKYRLPSSADLDTVTQRDDSLYDLKGPAPVKEQTPTGTPTKLHEAVGTKATPVKKEASKSDEPPHPAESASPEDDVPI